MCALMQALWRGGGADRECLRKYPTKEGARGKRERNGV